MTKLGGILSALSTPFTDGGADIDEAALRTLVSRTIDGNIHGIVPCGSTGEFQNMSTAERKRVAELTVDETAGRVPVVPHIGSTDQRLAIELAEHAQSIGSAGVLAVAPYYEPLEIEEMKDYYIALDKAIDIPIIIYNLPVATGVNLSPADVADIAEATTNVRYIKDTSGEFHQAAKLIHDFSDVIGTFVGSDVMLYASLTEGSSGSIVGASNIVPAELTELFDLIQADKTTEAKAIWARIFPLMQFLESGPYAAGVKSALKVMGTSIGDVRAPLRMVDGDRLAQLESIVKTLG